MTAEKAIESLDEMMGRLHSRVNDLSGECNAAVRQWDGLGRVGGQRADHAAALLGNVGTRLLLLRDCVNGCIRQIEAIQADPFGKKGG